MPARTPPQQAASAASGIVTRIIDPAAEPAWDQKLLQFPAYTLFHGSAWARVLKDSYGFSARYILGEEKGDPCGILPIMEADNWPKGRRGISLPFTDDCAVLTKESRTDKELIRLAMDEGRRRGWKYLELRGGSDFLPEARPSLSFYGHDLELDRGEKQLFERLSNSTKGAVRRAAKTGLIVEVANDLEAIRTFFHLHSRTRRKHGTPPQGFGFFENIHRHVVSKDHGFVMIARLSGKPVAAAIYFHFGRKAIYKFAASDDRFQEVRGNNLVMWEAIRRLAAHGFASLSLGRTILANEGLRRFKLSWGASESRLDYYKYDFQSGSFAADRDRAVGWQTRIFRLLPNSVLRWVGALLYPRLA